MSDYHTSTIRLRLTEEVAKNIKLTRAMQQFVRWFDQYDRATYGEERENSMFLDLRALADAARVALR